MRQGKGTTAEWEGWRPIQERPGCIPAHNLFEHIVGQIVDRETVWLLISSLDINDEYQSALT